MGNAPNSYPPRPVGPYQPNYNRPPAPPPPHAIPGATHQTATTGPARQAAATNERSRDMAFRYDDEEKRRLRDKVETLENRLHEISHQVGYLRRNQDRLEERTYNSFPPVYYQNPLLWSPNNQSSNYYVHPFSYSYPYYSSPHTTSGGSTTVVRYV